VCDSCNRGKALRGFKLGRSKCALSRYVETVDVFERDCLSDSFPARVIQEELLQDFSSNSELSNWLSREDLNPPAVVVKKPNPRNVQNTDKIKELEEHIQK
jgi:hypothetical protein